MMLRENRILIACDSFKGFFTSDEVNIIIKDEIKNKYSNAEIKTISLGDGGEGTLEALERILQIPAQEIVTYNALMQQIKAKVIIDGEKGYIEIAKIIGLTMTPLSKFNETSSYGVGEIISEMLKMGVKKFVICLGGSSTNDLGFGILEALGATICFDNPLAKRVNSFNLQYVNSINLNQINDVFKDIQFTILCDVKNPTYGEFGCTKVYALQKGASAHDLDMLDLGIQRGVEVLKNATTKDVSTFEGSGAAGGIACMFMSVFETKLVSGISYILELSNFEQLVKDTDLIITGEGCIDNQSSSGKFITGILEVAKKHNKDCYLVGGLVKSDKNDLISQGWRNVVNTMDYHDYSENIRDNKVLRLQKAIHFLMKDWGYDTNV